MIRVLSLFADRPADGYTYTGGTPAHAHGDPVMGWLMVAGIVAAVVLVAYVFARLGDLDKNSDKPA